MTLEEIVEEIVAVNYGTNFKPIADAILDRFGNEETTVLSNIMMMAEEKYDKLVADLYYFFED